MVIQHELRAARVRMFLAFAALFLTQVWGAGGGGLSFSQQRYAPCEVRNGGTIRGTVSLNGALPSIDRMEIKQDCNVCGTVKPSPRLVIGKDHGIADAIVYLEGVSTGKKFTRDADYLLEQRKCEYYPHILVVPVGQNLQIVNSDKILHNVHAYQEGTESKSVFNIAQPIKGVKSKTRAFTQPGIVRVGCDAGHPWMSAHIMVADHPYYAVTDRNGKFTLTDVPPGEYTLHLWHEGIEIAGKTMEGGHVKSYEFEQPYEASKKVTVNPKATSTTDFELSLR